MKQILQFQGTNSHSSPTSFQWDVNNTQYAQYDQNQWAGATFTVIQGSYTSGTSDPALGCTGTVASSTNQSGAGPVFVINSGTNQGGSGCAGSLGLAGQVIVIQTNNNMPNVFPTPSSIWTSGNWEPNGSIFGFAVSGGATATSETTDLCSTCGQQSMLLTIPSGGSVTVQGGPVLSSGVEKAVILNGTYTVSFWAKSNAAVPPNMAFQLGPRSGTACTQTFSGSTSPAITSTWTQFSFNCSFAETANAGGAGSFFTQIFVTPQTSATTSLELDNLSMVDTGDSNPTGYTDAYVNSVKAWCQSTANTTGPACTLRYGPSPDSETMANWVKPAFQKQPTIESMVAISTATPQIKTNPNDFLTLCEYVGATPILIIPVTITTPEIQQLMDFLEGPTSTTYGALRASLGQVTPWVGSSGSPFSKIYLEFGNENWNGGFIGQNLGYNSSAPAATGYYDYAVRAGVVFSAAHNWQSSQGYNQSGIKFAFNIQTAGNPADIPTVAGMAHPDAFEINGYTAYNVGDTSTTGCTGSGSNNGTCPLYGPTLTEPWSNTHDPNSMMGFYQSVQKTAATSLCGPSGKAVCESMVYEENTSPFNASTAGPFTQSVSDSFVQAAFQGIVTADQLGENDAAGVSNQNYYQMHQYSYGEGGVTIHMWGTMLDSGGDCSMNNSSTFGGSFCPRPQMLGAMVYNWCKIGPMVQSSWASNPTYNLPANNNSVNAINGVPVLRSFAFAQGGQRCMVIVNSDVASAYQVSFAGTNAPTNNVTTYQFAPGSLSSSNELGGLSVISTLQTPLSNTTTPGVDVTSGYTLPPHSVTAFMWQSNGSSSSPVAATPTFSLAGGTYTSAQTVTISSSTSGATIYYTTNGNTPTTSSAMYAGPITVSSTEQLQAIAVESGYTTSAVASTTYTISSTSSTLPTPAFSVAGGTYSSAQTVAISDATSGTTIYYTTNGTTPTTSSTRYSGAITVAASETVEAIAVKSGSNNSPVAIAAYTISSLSSSTLPAPTFSVAGGTYSTGPTVAISDATAGTTIYYTTDGSTPTTLANVYFAPVTMTSSGTLQAMAAKSGYPNSAVANATYTIGTSGTTPPPTTPPPSSTPLINFPSGFSGSNGQLALNGSATLSGSAVQLTSQTDVQTGTVWYTTPVDVQSFTTAFTFQLTNASADGMTFAIQNNDTSALGRFGPYLGYGSIPNSVAVKFDLYDNAGEGIDSTGLYTGGATPTVPAVDMTSSGVNLHSGDTMLAQLVYDGTTLTMTLTDTVTNASFTQSWTVNIPAAVGGNTAYVGFTGATGGETAIQDILSWTYTIGASGTTPPPTLPPPSSTPLVNFPSGFSGSSGQLALNGSATLSGSALQLTGQTDVEAGSVWYTKPVNVQSFTTTFTFRLTSASADGMTFAIQNNNTGALGRFGPYLGYGSIPKSVAVKLDLYNNAGEGVDSTGVYTGGATPTVPAVDMTSSGVNLHSGDTMLAKLVYNGTTLTLTLTDTVTKASFTKSWTVNIPAAVGGKTAYVGFTGATGGETAVQNILSWTL
ncbi:MAG: chitobiase/beta-hexosaminidase C-terminal domain-containing protein [Silvibacterium sp.]|nr:chitobiase/beta-hexosaminidase C-terminal domain-containing protein [Silvibacterium sp.]